MKKNVAGQIVSAVLVSATDGSAITAGVSVTVTGDGGTQGAGAGTVTHEGGGEWSYAPTQAETNFDHIAFKFSATGAIPVLVQVYTAFPQTGDSFARLGAPAGASVSADIAAIKTVVDAVKAKTDQLVFTIANKVDASIQAAGDFAQAAADKVWSSATRTLSAFGFSVTVGTNNDKTGYALSAAGVQAIWDALTSALTTVGSIGKLLVDRIDAAISSRSSHTAAGVWAEATRTITGGTVGTVGAGAIASTSFAAGAIDAAALADDAGHEIADQLLARSIQGGADGGRTVTSALRRIRNRVGIAAGTMTVYQEDDTTSAWQAAVTTAAGDPVSEVDPT